MNGQAHKANAGSKIVIRVLVKKSIFLGYISALQSGFSKKMSSQQARNQQLFNTTPPLIDTSFHIRQLSNDYYGTAPRYYDVHWKQNVKDLSHVDDIEKALHSPPPSFAKLLSTILLLPTGQCRAPAAGPALGDRRQF